MKTDASDEGEFLEILERQRVEYRKACRPRYEALRETCKQLAAGGSEGAMREALRQAHMFAGSGPTFGFDALGEAAATLEKALRGIGPRAVPTDAQRSEIESSLEVLARALPE